MKLDNFFTSGFEFTQKEMQLKSRYQMVNIALVTSSLAFIYGIIVNTINNIHGFVLFEILLITANVIMFFLLRKFKDFFDAVTLIITIQCTLFMLYIIYTTDVVSMKFIWLFTYPIVLLYFQKTNNGIYWFIFIVISLLIAPVQNFIEVKFTIFEVIYISVVLSILGVIVYFYQIKMNQAANIILKQQNMLLDFNTKLETQVKDKTSQLRELNDVLEKRIDEKVVELIQKDKLITIQSKQAVMGEMIAMIAHQWRQPLSTITLEISNLQLKRLLGEEMNCDMIDEKLGQISDTIVYLSDTIDDFQTYFHPQKDLQEIDIDELMKKAINFVLPRLQKAHIKIVTQEVDKVNITTYVNELIQVMMILLNNAIDALLERKIDNPKIDILAQEDGDKILIAVEDNAGGISDKNLPHIFEPYFSTKAKNGTGLGLYMAQMIVEKQFHGNITVESSSKGTIFTIEILKQIL